MEWALSEGIRCGSEWVMVAHSDDELLTVQEVAQLLRVPPSWVYERCREGVSDPLPHVKLGKYLRFSRNDLLRYLDKLRRGSGSEA